MASPAPACGIVFAASGAGYVALAEAAAASVRAVMPDSAIDLFSDAPPEGAVFDAAHALGRSGRRPKFEALRRSRFERTIYLDADLRVVADISDVFELLGRFDIAAAHDQFRNHGGAGPRHWQYPIPGAFGELNTGVIGVRRSPDTARLLGAVETALVEHDLGRDQPVFRQLLYESGLRLAVLPPEYNVMACRLFEAWDHSHPAPRVIHRSEFRHHLSHAGRPLYDSLDAILGPVARAHLDRLIAADRSLDPNATGRASRLIDRGLTGHLDYGYAWLLRRAAQLRDRLARARSR